MMTVNPDYGKASMLGSHFPVPPTLFYANSTKLPRFCPEKIQLDPRSRRAEIHGFGGLLGFLSSEMPKFIAFFWNPREFGNNKYSKRIKNASLGLCLSNLFFR